LVEEAALARAEARAVSSDATVAWLWATALWSLATCWRAVVHAALDDGAGEAGVVVVGVVVVVVDGLEVVGAEVVVVVVVVGGPGLALDVGVVGADAPQVTMACWRSAVACC
jgi:hypothetical protein